LIQSSVRWDDAALAVAREVLAKGLHPVRARAEIAARLGAAEVSASSLRNAFQRRGLPFTYTGEAATSQPPRPSERDTASGPATQPSVRGEYAEALVGGEEKAAAPAARTRLAIVAHDIHVPLQDPVWFDLFQQVAIGTKADTCFFNGDVIDCEALGSYPSRPGETAELSDEIIAANDFLDVCDEIGFAHKWLIWGNHDQGRAKRYVAEKARAMHKVFALEKELRLAARGWHTVDYKDHVFFGSCLLSHELGRGGRSAAAKTKDDVHGDVSTGHTHRFSYEARADVMGKVFFGASFGWGAKRDAAHYAHKAHVAATHILGLGLLTLDLETGQTFAEPVPIVNGRCVAQGKLYTSRVPVAKAVRRAA
jgi:predicted phosphodiesterase